MNETDRLRSELGEMRKDLETLNVRVYLAYQLLNFYRWAYDILLAYGVNFKDVKEYNEDTILDEASSLPITKARNKIAEYLKRLRSGVRAAVRRKNFIVH